MPVSIETLKQFALKVHNFACGTEWDDEGIVSAMVLDDIIEKMIKDEKMLEEQEDMLNNVVRLDDVRKSTVIIVKYEDDTIH